MTNIPIDEVFRDQVIRAYGTHHDLVKDNLNKAFDLIEDCGKTYKSAPDKIKRAFNQALFEKILVYSNGSISPEFNKPFNLLLGLKNPSVLEKQFDSDTSVAKETRITSIKATLPLKSRNLDQIFFDQGFSKNLLVRQMGLEPIRSRTRPSNVPVCLFQHCRTTQHE